MIRFFNNKKWVTLIEILISITLVSIVAISFIPLFVLTFKFVESPLKQSLLNQEYLNSLKIIQEFSLMYDYSDFKSNYLNPSNLNYFKIKEQENVNIPYTLEFVGSWTEYPTFTPLPWNLKVYYNLNLINYDLNEDWISESAKYILKLKDNLEWNNILEKTYSWNIIFLQ